MAVTSRPRRKSANPFHGLRPFLILVGGFPYLVMGHDFGDAADLARSIIDTFTDVKEVSILEIDSAAYAAFVKQCRKAR